MRNRIRLGVTLALIISCYSVGNATAATTPALLGDTNIESAGDGGYGTSEAFGYTAAATGTATDAEVYLTSTGGVRIGLYADKGICGEVACNQPGARLDQGSVTSNVRGWVDVKLNAGAQMAQGASYWLAIASYNGHRVRYRDSGSSGSNLDWSLNDLADPASPKAQWNSNPASVYLTGTTVAPVAPSNTTAPVVSGTPRQDSALGLDEGVWSGTAPITLTDQWQRDGADISGATGTTYTPTAADVGHTLDAVVTATNSAGNASRESNVVGPVTAGSTSGACPVSSGSSGPDGKNAPGSADPWGGCWPGPGNTGVPEGTSLTNVPADATSGPGWTWNADSNGIYVTQCGVTLQNLNIAGSLFVRDGNGTHSASTPCVTIKSSKITGYVDLSGACLVAECGPLVMTDDEIDTADMPAYQSNGYTIQVNRANVTYGNFYEWRVNNHGGNGPDHCDGNCEVHDSWEHGLVVQANFHMNAVGSNGTGVGNKLTAVHNYMSCGWDQAAILPPVTDSSSGAGCTSDLAMLPDFATVTLDAETNYFAPSRSYFDTSDPYRWFQPSDCLYPGQGTQKPYPTVNDYIANNVWAHGPSGTCGTDAYGSGTNTAVYGWGNSDVHQNGTDSGNVWGPGNMYDDGKPVGP